MIPAAGAAGTMADGTANPFTNVIPGYLCPSDTKNQTASFGTAYSGCCNYGCSRGDFMIGTNWSENRNKRGVFFDGSIGGQMTLETVTDGTSNTLLFGEICVSINNNGNNDAKDIMYKSTLTSANIHGKPVSTCLAMRGEKGMVSGGTT